jgi:hopanoid biosynthesis associated protein HpnK
VKRLIVTGDDFGASIAVNEAIERAHLEGVLNTTCLMVAGAAADDAVKRAKRMPALRVGLHIVLVDGRPLLPPGDVLALVDGEGRFANRLAGAGFNFFFNPAARRQLDAEIRAQFQAYRATGLPLDHANGHNHMHLHPTVLSAIIRIGREHGLRAVRVPYEPLLPSWRAMRSDLGERFGNGVLLAPVLGLMRARLHAAGLRCNDFVFGLNDTSHMTRDRVLALLRELPDGVTEMYFHPATSRTPEMPVGAQCHEELLALTDPQVAQLVRDAGITMTTFTDLAGAAA